VHERRPTQNILHAQRPTSRHPGPCGSCCELEVTTVAKRWVRQFDADCHAAFAAVVTSGVSHRICCVCLNSARLKTSCMHSARPQDTPDPLGAAGGYDSGEAVVQAVRCWLTRRLRCRRDLRRLPQDLLRLPEQRPTQNIPPSSRHPGPCGSCWRLRQWRRRRRINPGSTHPSKNSPAARLGLLPAPAPGRRP